MLRVIYCLLGLFLGVTLTSYEYNNRIMSITEASYELAAVSYMYSCAMNTDKSLEECRDKAAEYIKELLELNIQQVK